MFSLHCLLRLKIEVGTVGGAPADYSAVTRAAVSHVCLLQLVILFHSMEGSGSDRMK